LYLIKKISDVLMSDSASLKLCHMNGYVGLKGMGLEEGWEQWLVGRRAADTQHGNRVEGGSHLAQKAINPGKGFFAF
jgi:hypothetical protein